ncbi:MAG: hypothetical protein KAT68_15590 [Bacteroidales bacterium]|nr:hypothetical protein [Bacteroidales bacterium]
MNNITNIIIKAVFILFLAIFNNTYTTAQPNNIKERIFFGGNLGLQFGTITYIDISPFVGYKIADNLESAIGITYQYYNDRRYTGNVLSTSIYGGKVFIRYIFVENIFAHAEYEILSLETKYFKVMPSANEKKRFLLNNILIGGGYRQKIGQKSFITFTILWNINENINSPYNNPVMRIGYIFYF